MEVEEYINRVFDQLSWYEKKTLLARRRHVFLKILNSICLAITPAALMVSYIYRNYQMGIIIAIGTSLASLIISSYRDLQRLDTQWEQYRLTAEQLRKELTMFTMNASEYGAIENEKEKRNLFIQKVESLLSKEHSLWWVGEKRKSNYG